MKRLACTLAASLLSVSAIAAPPDDGADTAERPPGPVGWPLELSQVLDSVEAHFPLLRAAEAELRIAAGARREAAGSFDLRVRAEGDLRPAGFYNSYSGGATLEQPTRLWGARLFGGYRIGRGDFAAYDGALQTDRRGEISAGVEVPLLRGGSTDETRVKLRQAEIVEANAVPLVALRRIEIVREATLAYWTWVAAGLTVDVTERLLAVAESRQSQIEGRVRRGALPRIDLLDNERLVVDRRIRLRGAQRDVEQQAIALSLFLRDRNGDPLVPGLERLPADFPPERMPSRAQFETDLARAREEFPFVQTLRLERERLEQEQALARNEMLPAFDLRVEGSRDYGRSKPGISSEGSLSSSPRNDTEVKAMLRFEIPVQQREARGRLAQARARLSRIESELRFAHEQVEADVRRAMAGLEAAFALTAEARRNLELAVELQRAEERKLMLGTSNLINVNIRELQAAQAGVALIETQADFFRALAEYRAAAASS